ncbi:hypothetical protein NDU88_004759 [Pleurodeles waltl]|uniref:Uncharacterized protein n=1 Tax=Pleurodeles waltl TaxID=8319 RepID=A0AAV7VHY1_PLEWA|nr:hypothetical protein NDU88_004759 [Pleurodeles waltl]
MSRVLTLSRPAVGSCSYPGSRSRIGEGDAIQELPLNETLNHGGRTSHEEPDRNLSSTLQPRCGRLGDSHTLPSNALAGQLPVLAPFLFTGIASPSPIRERDPG